MTLDADIFRSAGATGCTALPEEERWKSDEEWCGHPQDRKALFGIGIPAYRASFPTQFLARRESTPSPWSCRSSGRPWWFLLREQQQQGWYDTTTPPLTCAAQKQGAPQSYMAYLDDVLHFGVFRRARRRTHTHTHTSRCHKKGESRRDADADTVAEPRAVDRAAECTRLPPKKWGAWLELRESFSRKCPKICSQAQPCWFGPSCIFPSARWGGIGRTCPCLQLLQARPPRPESRPFCIPVRWSRSVLRLVANLRIGVVFARAREMVAAGSKNFDAPSQQFCGRAKRFEEPPLMDELPASQQQQQQQQHRPELPSSLAAFGGLLSILGAACPPCFSHSHTPPRTNHLLTYTSGAAIVKTRPRACGHSNASPYIPASPQQLFPVCRFGGGDDHVGLLRPGTRLVACWRVGRLPGFRRVVPRCRKKKKNEENSKRLRSQDDANNAGTPTFPGLVTVRIFLFFEFIPLSFEILFLGKCIPRATLS